MICLFDLACVSCVQLQTNVSVFCVKACYYGCFSVSYAMIFRLDALMHKCLSSALKFCLLSLLWWIIRFLSSVISHTFSYGTLSRLCVLIIYCHVICFLYYIWSSAIKNTVKSFSLEPGIIRSVLANIYSYISWVFAGSRTGSSQGGC